jgi:hypothetical protein
VVKFFRGHHRIVLRQLACLSGLFFFLHQISHQAYLILTNIFDVGISLVAARVAISELVIPGLLAQQRQALFYV